MKIVVLFKKRIWPEVFSGKLLTGPALISLFGALFFMAIIGSQGVHIATKDPSFCVSCHVMEPVYGTWSHSSHREIVDCNGCHTDQSNYFTKTYSKVIAGIQHLYHNNFGEIPEPIRLAQSNTQMVQENCLRCHHDIVRNLRMDADRRCFDCHRYTPHANFR
ncbi:MAG: cytochrome c nitrite reductase small subunit [Clostridia bacterium]|jgi:cytochrome c nitrite reductase small subunit|nr:cytochrome c nitrite reductase small subunit [Clostridia bacterium]